MERPYFSKKSMYFVAGSSKMDYETIKRAKFKQKPDGFKRRPEIEEIIRVCL